MTNAEQFALTIDDSWLPLDDGDPMTVTANVDDITSEAIKPYDLEWAGQSTFVPLRLPSQLPDDFGIGVIVGASGSGKSTLLKSFGTPEFPVWREDTPIAGHFGDADTAATRFAAVGLNSVPTWTKPYRVLSNGERFRADLARIIGDGAVVDEFTSVVDRHVAASASNALRRYVAERNVRRVVIASCHRDVLPWLQPDWVIDTDVRAWALRPRECLQRPDIVVEVYQASSAAWDVFAKHHYLSAAIHESSRCFVAVWNGQLVGFSSVMSFPNGAFRNAWREHRTVILPDFQGLGIGVRLSDWVAALLTSEGKRFYSRTAHPRMGAYRDTSPLWRATKSSRRQNRKLADYMSDKYLSERQIKSWDFDDRRVAWSHEYVGPGLDGVARQTGTIVEQRAEVSTQTALWGAS